MTPADGRRGGGAAGSEGPRVWIPLLLIAVFVLPIVIAWLYASGTLGVRDRGLLNRGTLLDPAIDLTHDESTRRLPRRTALSPGQWAMLYLHAGPCDRACEGDLDKLLTVRAALGRDAGRVRAFGLFERAGPVAAEGVPGGVRLIVDRALYQALVAGIRSRDAAAVFPAVLLFDWRGRMMMRYERDALPQDINTDLKRLLKASRLR